MLNKRLEGFISIVKSYAITEVPISKAPVKRSNDGRFQKNRTFKTVDL